MILQTAEEWHFRHPYVEALVLAILVGIAIRSFWEPGARWKPGRNFSAKLLLETAVMMLGASISFGAILASGSLLIAAIAFTVTLAQVASDAISPTLRLPQRISILIASGSSICGDSAIGAVAPVIGANGEDIAASIAFTAVLGVIIVLGLPQLFPLLKLAEFQCCIHIFGFK